jgi:hypothetical protein
LPLYSNITQTCQANQQSAQGAKNTGNPSKQMSNKAHYPRRSFIDNAPMQIPSQITLSRSKIKFDVLISPEDSQ